jgi:phosphoribosylformimino-5-aminoimidazole carboxamide ribotide isomerase
MNLYPAIDLYQGKVVRLVRGDFQKETVYSTQPETIAREWQRQGAEWLHVVDLEGAKTGILQNKDTLLKIRKAVKCRIQFGGGLRNLDQIQSVLQEGIERVVLGTKSLDESFLKQVLEKYGRQIAVGLDVHNGFVQMEGWLKASQKTLVSALSFFKHFPIRTMIYTDIQKDGMLQGPDFSGLNEVLEATPARVILSGGIGGLMDIQKAAEIKKNNFEGVIIGKALYEKKFTLEQAVQIAATGTQE